MKISAFIVVFSLLCVTTFGQTVKESQVPAIVKTEFSKKFPAASSINWEMENANEYEAEFRMSGIEISASFSAAGNWLLTETEISFGELPQAVTNSFLKNHKHTSKVEVEKIELASGKIIYEIAMASGSEDLKGSKGSKAEKGSRAEKGSKGSKNQEYFYDDNGIELKGSKL